MQIFLLHILEYKIKQYTQRSYKYVFICKNLRYSEIVKTVYMFKGFIKYFQLQRCIYIMHWEK